MTDTAFQALCAAIPLLAALAGFISILGRAAYYRIIIEYDTPTLQTFVSQFGMALLGIACIAVPSVTLSQSAYLFLALLALISMTGLLCITKEIHHEIAAPEFLVYIVGVLALSIILISSIVIGIIGPDLFEANTVFTGNQENLSKNNLYYEVLIIELAVVFCVGFFELGYFGSKQRTIYLTDPESKTVLLSTFSGGRVFARRIKRLHQGVCILGREVEMFALSSGSQYEWCRYKKVVIERSNCDYSKQSREKRASDEIRTIASTRFKTIIKATGVSESDARIVSALEKCGHYAKSGKKSRGYDVLHVNTVDPLTLISMNLNRGHRLIVATAHSTAEVFERTLALSYRPQFVRLVRWWLGLFYRSADLVIAPTEYVKALLNNVYYVETPIVTISNGIDLSMFHPLDKNTPPILDLNKILTRCDGKTKNKIDSRSDIVICIGSIVERKGVLDFIDLARKSPSLEFVWIGSQPPFLPKNIKKAVAASSSIANLHFPGYIEPKTLVHLYNRASLFILLSKEETEGLVVLESLACKTKTLVSDIPAFNDWLIDGINCFKTSLPQQDENRDDDLDKLTVLIASIISCEHPDVLEKGYRTAHERRYTAVGEELYESYTHALF